MMMTTTTTTMMMMMMGFIEQTAAETMEIENY